MEDTPAQAGAELEGKLDEGVPCPCLRSVRQAVSARPEQLSMARSLIEICRRVGESNAGCTSPATWRSARRTRRTRDTGR